MRITALGTAPFHKGAVVCYDISTSRSNGKRRLDSSVLSGNGMRLKPQDPAFHGVLCLERRKLKLDPGQAVVNGAEGVADNRAKDHERRDYNDGNQNEN